MRRAKTPRAPQPAEHSHIPLWKKALRRDAEWEKTELSDVVHWARQILGIICGILWGVIPLYGMAGNLSFLFLNVTLLFLYYTKFLNVDDEQLFGGRWDLIQEGFFTSYAIFLVVWIITFNLLQVKE